MKASYKLALEQQQRRLNLTHKQLNKYDRKHNDINLIKYLMSLEPTTPATGFYGLLTITNHKNPGTDNIDIYARLYYNGNPLTNEITIPHGEGGGNTRILPVLIADRLPSRESILTLQVRFETGITVVDLDAYSGFEPAGLTENPLTENNYLSMLVNEGNVDDGDLSITFLTTT
jgi:hypothetical protein